MGVNRETREFFTGRINEQLDEQLAEVNKYVDKDLVKNKAIELFCEKAGDKELMKSWSTFNKKEKELEAEKEILQSRTNDATEKITGERSGSYSRPTSDTVVSQANRNFSESAMSILYPEIIPEIEKIDAVRKDIQGAVLLATTEPKLVKALTTVLTNYGGDISSILNVLPKME